MGEAGPETERAEETAPESLGPESLGEVVGTVELTEADYVEAYVGYATEKKLFSATRGLVLIVVALTSLLVIAAWPVAPGLWTATLVFWSAAFFLVRLQYVWIARWTFAQVHPKRRRLEMRFDDDGFASTGPCSRARASWAVLTGWAETERVFALASAWGVGVVPKRAFDTDQLERLRALFVARIVTPTTTPSKREQRSQALKTVVLWLGLVVMFTVVFLVVRRAG